MPKDAKLKAADRDDRLVEQQQAEEQEFQGEVDWEEIEKHLSDDPELAEEIKKDLSDYPELSEYRELIRQKATLQRMRRFSSEGNWERFKTEVEGLPLKEQKEFDKELISALMRKFHLGAWQEVLELDWTRRKGQRGLQYMVAVHPNQSSGWHRIGTRTVDRRTEEYDNGMPAPRLYVRCFTGSRC